MGQSSATAGGGCSGDGSGGLCSSGEGGKGKPARPGPSLPTPRMIKLITQYAVVDKGQPEERAWVGLGFKPAEIAESGGARRGAKCVGLDARCIALWPDCWFLTRVPLGLHPAYLGVLISPGSPGLRVDRRRSRVARFRRAGSHLRSPYPASSRSARRAVLSQKEKRR